MSLAEVESTLTKCTLLLIRFERRKRLLGKRIARYCMLMGRRGAIICKLDLHHNGGSLAIATASEVEKKAPADLSPVSSTRTATTRMLATSTALREGSAIVVFSYCHLMAQ